MNNLLQYINSIKDAIVPLKGYVLDRINILQGTIIRGIKAESDAGTHTGMVDVNAHKDGNILLWIGTLAHFLASY